MRIVAPCIALAFCWLACGHHDTATADLDAAAVDAAVAAVVVSTAPEATDAAVAAHAHKSATHDGGAAGDAGATTKTDGGAASGKAPGAIGGPCAEGWRCNGAGTCTNAVCTCEVAKYPNLHVCGDLCSVAFDAANCGTCGNRCKESEECGPTTGGKAACHACSANGPDWKDCAPNRCANLKVDSGNCGACGTRCNAPQVCIQGACKKL